MGPAQLNLKMRSNADFVEEVLIEDLDGNPQDITGWLFRLKAKRRLADTEYALDIAIEPTAPTEGQVPIHAAQADIAAALGETENRVELIYDLICKPAVDYPVALYYGTIEIARGVTDSW